MTRGGTPTLATVRRAWRVHLPVILAYGLLALVLTWPLVTRLTTHVPGNGVDDPPLTWNLWWISYALQELGQNPFDGTYLFHPIGINLAYYTLTIINGLLSIPLQAVFGLVPASNLVLLSSFVLGAYGAFLLSLSLLGRQGARAGRHSMLVSSFVAGLLYAFASSKLFYASLGQWNIASSQWIPFYVLYLFRLGDQPARWRNAILAGLFLLLQAYAELTYATFLALFTGLWLAWRVLRALRQPRATRSWRFLPGLAVVGLIFALGLLPMLVRMIPDMLVEGDFLVEGEGFAGVFSADLIGYLLPGELHPLLGGLVARTGIDHGVGQHIFLGYAALALAVLGVVAWWRRPVVRFWALSAIVFWLLTLGPSLRVNGADTGWPLPFALVAQLPFLKGNRYPSRYSVMLVLSIAVLVAFGLAALIRWVVARPGRRRIPRRALVSVVALTAAALLLFEHLSLPLPLSDMRVPPVYRALADEMPGDFALLDLPVAWRNGFRVTGTQDPIIMFQQYYQTAHKKPILAGNTSRNPPLKFQYFTGAPVINTLIALETGHAVDAAVIERDRHLATDVLRFFGIEAIVIHPAQAGPAVKPYVEGIMPVQPFFEDESTVAYRVEPSPWPNTWQIVPGDELSRLSFAEGWGPPDGQIAWAQRRSTRLLVPLNGAGQRMAFRAYVPEGGQRLTVTVNGHEAGWIGMAAGWMEYDVTLPAGAVQQGLNKVALRFDTLFPPEQVDLSPRSIGETGTESPVNLVAESAGQEVGDFGMIYVNGQNVSPNLRGYNVAVLHPTSGEVERTVAFDTHLDPDGSQALAAFLKSVLPGRIVAVVAADEASRLLSPDAVEALRGIGATGDLRDRYRWGHAIVGVKGAEPGTALEAMDWMRPVTLVVGEGATEPSLAAGFSEIGFAPLADP